MKKAIGLFALVMSASIYSQACTQIEAQFMGTVKKVTQSKDSCSIQIQFSSYDSSIMCPLEIEEVIDQNIEARCGLQVGDAVSGVLVNDGKKTYIE